MADHGRVSFGKEQAAASASAPASRIVAPILLPRASERASIERIRACLDERCAMHRRSADDDAVCRTW